MVLCKMSAVAAVKINNVTASEKKQKKKTYKKKASSDPRYSGAAVRGSLQRYSVLVTDIRKHTCGTKL